MIFYTWFLMIAYAVVLITSRDYRERFTTVLGFLVMLPLFGRVLGWF